MPASLTEKEKKRFFWSDKRIAWYDLAARENSYHDTVINELLPYVSKNSVVFDVACGLGYLSEKISPYVDKVYSFDYDQNAIASLRDRCKSISNIECVFGDWHENLKNRKCDVSIMSYCNGIIDYFDFLKSVTNRYIIGIHLFKNKVHNFGVNNHTDISQTFNRRETSQSIMAFLDEKNIPYTLKRVSCEFGQPFLKKEEANDFIREYFKISEEEKISEIVEANLIKKENYYYLPNMKHSGIIIIDLKSLKEG